MKQGLAASLALKGVEVDMGVFVKTNREDATLQDRNYPRMLEDPGERQVHDARTATRRAEALLALLPRRLRDKGKTRELGRRHRMVMEKTARVRDMDILRTKLSMFEGAEGLLEKVGKERARATKAALAAVSSANELDVPVLGLKDARRGRLQRRFEKVTLRLAKGADATLREVVANPSDRKALHRLRVDLKRMRYLVEAVSTEHEGAARLEAMQDSLGSIHDWDVGIDFVRKADPGWDQLQGWVAQRERECESFVESLG